MAESLSQTKIWGGVKKPPGHETASNVVLSVSPNDEDCASLERIFQSRWTVIASAAGASALSVLREIPIPIVICDCDITPGSWGEMLDHISLLFDPPLFIVTSRLADERLWAEALNLGAWDVLAKPFDPDEVIRVVSVASQHWRDRRSSYIRAAKPRKLANENKHMAATGT